MAVTSRQGAPVDLAALRLQVIPRGVSDVPAGVARQPVPFEFEAVLVGLDSSGQAGYVSTAQAESIGGVAGAVATAQRQTMAEELAGLQVIDEELAGESLRMITSEGSQFVTTVLLSLTHYLQSNVPHGALIIAPSYDTIGLHEVWGKPSIDFIPELAAVAAELNAASAAPCSPDVYWWYGQQFNRVDIGYDGDQPVLDFPTDLRDVVWSLS